MIDLHSHILPGIDDGPSDVAVSLHMARAAAADGARVVACTSHRHGRYPTPAARVHEGIAALQPLIDDAGIALRLVPGLEIALDQVAGMDDDELKAASLGDGRWLLLEMPFKGWPLELPQIMTALEVRGFRTLLAHPERNESVQANPDRMRDLVGRGALVQVTAASLTGAISPAAERASHALLRAGLIHVIASDMHSMSYRPPGLLAGLAAAAGVLRTGADKLAWMVRDIPQAIVSGAEVRPPQTGRPVTQRGSQQRVS